MYSLVPRHKLGVFLLELEEEEYYLLQRNLDHGFKSDLTCRYRPRDKKVVNYYQVRQLEDPHGNSGVVVARGHLVVQVAAMLYEDLRC